MEQHHQHLWSHLPDLCLLAVFKYIPVSDMIRSVGRVSTNWARVQRDELRRRNTLVIATVRPRDNDNVRILEELREFENPFGSELIEHVLRDDGLPWAQLRPLNQIEFNTLRVPSNYRVHYNVLCTEAFTSLVMDTLPNITHLTLVLHVPLNLIISSLHHLTCLISHYTTSLVDLKLDFKRDFSANAYLNNLETVVPLFNSINRLESLRYLRLNIRNVVDSYLELSILSRLTTFTSDTSYPVPALLASLRQYATGDDLRIESATRIELEELVELDQQLASKFTRLDHVILDLDKSPYDMRLFCQGFVSLHTLGLDTEALPMTVLTRCLSKLPELVHLKMIFNLLPEKEEVEEDDPQPELTPVPSVRLLTLELVTTSHHDTELLHLHQIFPNLQVLHFRQENDQCQECHYDYVDFCMEPNLQLELQPKILNCMHLTRQPFRQCANLHTIKLDSDEEALRNLLPQGLITRDQL